MNTSAATPKQDPAHLELRVRPRPVTRLNRRAIVLITTAIAAAILASVFWGLRTPKPSVAAKAEEKRAPDRITRAPGLSTLPRDYSSIPKPASIRETQVPELGPPLGEFGQPLEVPQSSSRRSTQDLPARGGSSSGRRPLRADTDSNAKIFFELTERRNRTPPESHVGVSAARAAETSTAGITERKSEIYGSGVVQHPRSERQLMAGTLIRAALVTGINSDLPGQVIATVVENVFDTATGSRLLVPQGSRLLGQYSEEGAYGQRRVFVKWVRLIRPDNSSIVLDDLPGVDAAGYAGLEDQVDEHMKRVLGGAALSTVLGIGTELASPNRSSRDGAVIIAARDSVHDTINDVGQQMTRRNLDMRPTRIIRPGYPVNILINKDLIL